MEVVGALNLACQTGSTICTGLFEAAREQMEMWLRWRSSQLIKGLIAALIYISSLDMADTECLRLAPSMIARTGHPSACPE